MLEYDYVSGWCAACKVSGITDHYVTQQNFPSLETIMFRAAREQDGSVVMVTVNVEETNVIKWLKDNKFKKGPIIQNWGHGGRKTLAYFKQIPRKIWREATGHIHSFNDYGL